MKSWLTPKVNPEDGSYFVSPAVPAKSHLNPAACNCTPNRAREVLSVPIGPVEILRLLYRSFTSPTSVTRRCTGYWKAAP